MPHENFLSAEDEKARYDLHQNSPNDNRYRQFLNRIFVPMQERIAPESCGMDFGSGPGPTLSIRQRSPRRLRSQEMHGRSWVCPTSFCAAEPVM